MSWSLPSFSSLATSLTELSSTVTSKATDLTSTLSSSVSHLIEDTKKSFEEEQSKVDSRRAQLQSLSSRPKPTPLWKVSAESQQILEAELKARILRLSSDPRTFLSPAPDEAFAFSLDVAYPWCEVALQEDVGLSRARYRLVPRRVSERQFWKNYCWRVQSIREQMGVGDLWETSQLEADADREKLRAERVKKREDEATEKKAALPVAAPAPSAEKAAAERKAPSPPLPRASPSPTPAGKGAEGGQTEVDSEFISDDYVNVASQDVALVGAMRKELGLQAETGNKGGKGGRGASPSPLAAGEGGEGLEGVTDADLDDLETMLADIDVNDGEARDDLLDELEGMDEKKLP